MQADTPSDANASSESGSTSAAPNDLQARPSAAGRRGHHRKHSSISVKVQKRGSAILARPPGKEDPPDNVLSTTPASTSTLQAPDRPGVADGEAATEDRTPATADDSSLAIVPELQPSPDSDSSSVNEVEGIKLREDNLTTFRDRALSANVAVDEDGGAEEAKEMQGSPQLRGQGALEKLHVQMAQANQEDAATDAIEEAEDTAPALPAKDVLHTSPRPQAVIGDAFNSPPRDRTMLPTTGSLLSGSPRSGTHAQWATRRDAMRTSLLSDLGTKFNRRPSASSVGGVHGSPRASASEQEAAMASVSGSKTIPLRRGKRMSIGYISSGTSSPAMGSVGGRFASFQSPAGAGAEMSGLDTPGSVTPETNGYAADASASSDVSYFNYGAPGARRIRHSPSISSASSATSPSRFPHGLMSSIGSASHSGGAGTGALTPTLENGLPASVLTTRMSLLDSPTRGGAGKPSIGLGGTGPREEVEAAMARSKNLLSAIAAKEQRCLDLKEELGREEAELKALRDAWQRSVANTIATEGLIDQPLQKAAGRTSFAAMPLHACHANSGTGAGISISSLSSVTSGNTSVASETSELAAMQAAAAETIKGWSGKISNFFEVALAAPTPDPRFSTSTGIDVSEAAISVSSAATDEGPVPDLPMKDSRTGLESLSEAEEDEASMAIGGKKAADTKSLPKLPAKDTSTRSLLQGVGGSVPRTASLSSSRSAQSKRTSVFGAFPGFNVVSFGSVAMGEAGGNAGDGGANAAGGWGTWSQRLKEAREGASTLLAKAEKGLESIVTIDEGGMAERERPRIEGGIVLDDSAHDGSMPRRIHLDEANERERTALRGLGTDWFRSKASSPTFAASPPPPPDSARLSPSPGLGSKDEKRLSTSSNGTIKSGGSASSLSRSTSTAIATNGKPSTGADSSWQW
ncbi:hypothetical protein K437DRAFT_295959 [Tilletiaria anomala UBC 951]|uniref:DUF4048 domain-containing protein n=1 Tax=Tilletiaria anomala (strain ATCC 24038 / CBS 436.72 / UBC 951) TaxID=1037660 RepID=A0A066VES0_TILAU|nr:uncharacterized protein K437DRAFT_295959 [Tilletiaria anomala UBC 951]KDN39941.1 hypothetical protein K437DRAFT_295959 [Tilletiaria anomala UBC 951]